MKRRLLILILVLSFIALPLVAACGNDAPAPAPVSAPAPAPAPAPTPAPKPDVAEEGKTLFISKACIGCHTIQGMPEAQGTVGPELTHQASNSMIVDVLPNTEENLLKYLKDPAAVKSGALMPPPNLTDGEIEALIAFLRTLK